MHLMQGSQQKKNPPQKQNNNLYSLQQLGTFAYYEYISRVYPIEEI